MKSRLLAPLHAAADLPAQVLEKLGYSRHAWQTRLPSEISYWEYILSTGEWQATEDFKRRTTPGTPLQDFLARLLPQNHGSEELRILDIGAGPLTQVGSVYRNRRLQLVPIDPLADAYDQLLEKHGVVPPVRTVACDAERVADRFGESTFDLVYARNCLDHSYEPMTAIRQAVAVVKPGCYVYLEHSQNEAAKENGHGLHKWNFRAVDGAFVIEREGREIDVTSALSDQAESSCHIDENDILTVLLKKRPSAPIPARH